MELCDSTPRTGSVKLLKKKWEAASAPRPSLELRRPPAPWSPAPRKRSRGSAVDGDPAGGGRADVLKEEPLGAACQPEPCSLTVKELKSRFEALAASEFPRCTQALSQRRENKGEKDWLDQPSEGAPTKEALRQPNSTMPCAASKIKAINAIIKNHHDGVRGPHHQGAGLPVQEAHATEGCVLQTLPQRQPPQRREPLRQPRTKINCAASILKGINEMHSNLQLRSQRPPQHRGTTFPDENAQCLETPTSDDVNKDTRRTKKKKKRTAKGNQQGSDGNVQVEKHCQKTADVSQQDSQSACCAERTTSFQ